MSTTDTTTSDSSIESDVPADYTETSRACYDSQQDVADAWAAGHFPTHNTDRNGSAYLYCGQTRSSERAEVVGSSTNFHGIQRTDGSGVLMHYSTREAVRLTDGTIIDNQQCWATGFAHCSHPPSVDYKLPLDVVEVYLDDRHSLEDIQDVYGQPTYSYKSGELHESIKVADSIVVIESEHARYGIYFGRDNSIANGNEYTAIRLSREQLQQVPKENPELVPKMFLRPPEVQDSFRKVVDSGEYTKTRLSALEADQHESCGGNITVEERRYSERNYNYQHFRADMQNTCIVRQGEWFFIPLEEDFSPDSITGTQEARDMLDNHVADRRWGACSPLPTECENCGASDMTIQKDGSIDCNDCGSDIERAIYVRGQISHLNDDHDAVNLGDRWHMAVTHDQEVMMYDDNPTVSSRRSRRYE
jgi:hypothetical protein